MCYDINMTSISGICGEEKKVSTTCCIYVAMLCKYVCHVMSHGFVASWLGSLVRRC